MSDASTDAATATWVVVPAHNESAWIAATVDAVATQRGVALTLLVVDNASTDDTAGAVHAAASRHTGVDIRVLVEPEKGTGAASDSGCRHAIEHGARVVLRTDADCVPDPDWARTMLDAIDAGNDLVAGNLRARRDDGMARGITPYVAVAVFNLIRFVGRIRPNNNDDPAYRTRMVVTPGANLAIRAETYLASGGFPRTRIEDAHEDKELVNRVRRVSDRIAFERRSIVRFSNRRAARNGIVGSLRWYLNHGGSNATRADVR